MSAPDTLKHLARRVRITSTYGAIKQDWSTLDDWQKHAHPYRVTLRYQRRAMSVDFFMGPALTAEPDAEGVLDCLLSDANAAADSFENFCAEFGYDTDSRKAERIYEACRATGAKLRRLLGNDFDRFLRADR